MFAMVLSFDGEPAADLAAGIERPAQDAPWRSRSAATRAGITWCRSPMTA